MVIRHLNKIISTSVNLVYDLFYKKAFFHNMAKIGYELNLWARNKIDNAI